MKWVGSAAFFFGGPTILWCLCSMFSAVVCGLFVALRGYGFAKYLLFRLFKIGWLHEENRHALRGNATSVSQPLASKLMKTTLQHRVDLLLQ